MSDGAAGPTPTLAAFLAERGLPVEGVRCIRHTLDPRDRMPGLAGIGDLEASGLLGVYERMQEGRRLGHDNPVLSFVADGKGLARLVGYRQVFARRKGIAPADIVYDEAAQHLLHNFISRARCPVFYDTIDLEGLEDVIGRLVVLWPRPHMINVRPASHSGLVVVGGASFQRDTPPAAP